jgi:disulfide oxidoreductase YuzD
MERVRNVTKYDTKKARKSGRDPPSSPKRHRKAANASLVRRCPVSSYELSYVATTERHNKAVSDELKKSRPKDALMLPLLKVTFGERRIFIMNEATCVADVLERHPGLSRTAVVSQSFMYKMSEESIYLLLLIIGIDWVKYVKPPPPPEIVGTIVDHTRM